MYKRLKKINWSIASHILFFIILAGIIAFTVFGDSGLYQLHSLYKSKHKLTYQINENKTMIESLKSEKIRLNNPDYLESIIRKELGYVKDGEVVYQITPWFKF